jgi:DNA-binding GntR family transcriptional regulator
MIERAGSGSDSLVRRTTDALRRMIVEGDLSLGESLSEAKAARWLDVSRTPVREAFVRLEIEGLVVSEPQRRTRVFMPRPKDVDDICVARGCLESKALVLAMERRRVELAAALAKTANLMTEALQSQDIAQYLRLDSTFHQAIFDHADNAFLRDAYQTIAPKLAALRTRLPRHLDYLKKGYGEHLSLSELVAAGDVESALRVLDEHISRKEDSFWRLNDEWVEIERRRTGRGSGREKLSASADGSSPPARPQRARAPEVPAVLGDENSARSERPIDEKRAASKSLDENTAKNSGDEKRRGRPRIHADGAARKRAWAARAREEKKRQRLILGQSSPKRGRPRNAAEPFTPRNAGPDAKV